jgi:2-polyprenyl-6-hydroxyphenyl methylase/3-demethylubiquinone-9 3-methyltransferase
MQRVPRLEDLTNETERGFCKGDHRTAEENFGFVALGRYLRLLLTVGMANRLGRNLRILDGGCGGSDAALALAKAGHDVVGVDLRPDALVYSRRKYDGGKIEWICANVEQLPFGREFDLVILSEILEHAAHPDRMLSAAAAVVKPGGHILITTPNWEFFANRLQSLAELVPDAEAESKQYREDADGHLFIFKAEELRSLIRGAGLELGRIRFHNSPFANGSGKFRYVGRFLPVAALQALEATTCRLPWVRRKVCLELAALARVPAE